jgi:hypothetical protein
MREDDGDRMDALLREALTAPAPRLSPAFDAKVMARVRPARLTSPGRMLMALYAIAAVVVSGWVIRDVPVEWIAASVAVCVLAAVALALYARHLADA